MNNNIMEVRNITLKISEKEILKNISFYVKEKEILSILGESGSGKTILSKLLMALIYKKGKLNGKIFYKEKNIFNFNKEELRKYRGEKIGYITQNPLNIFLPFQKIKITFLETYLSHLKINKKEALNLARKNLKEVNLELEDEILNKYPYELSGGMLQRIMIAIILGLDSEIIIADEITSALDSYNTDEIKKLLKNLKEKGKTIILITHDYDLMKEISDRCIILDKGQVKEIIDFNDEHVKNSKYLINLKNNMIYKRKDE